MSDRPLRIWRSPYSNFQGGETRQAADVYTPKELGRIAAEGFTAIWMHGLLREMAPSRVFSELGRGSAAHLKSLRTVIRRAAKVGLDVYLYMQPPRGMERSRAFWRRHPEARGASYRHFGKDMCALCTSAQSVKDFLRDSASRLSSELPGLAGAILITAAEYVGHCYTKYRYVTRTKWGMGPNTPLGCPRCEQRHPSDVVVEIITTFRDAFAEAGNRAEVIAWDWAWSGYEPLPAQRIMSKLPRDVRLLLNFETGGVKHILGADRPINEYALCYPGPSEGFVKTLRLARGQGLKAMSKLQIGTTHEMATVPNLPLIGSLYEKARAMRRLRVRNFLGCWNFGNMPTANSAAFIRFMEVSRLPPRRKALEDAATHYLPGCDAPEAAKAWEGFGKAMDSYPFCVPFMYTGPLNFALEYPIVKGSLEGKPMGRSWLPDERGDVLDNTVGPFTFKEIVQGLGEVTATWRAAADLFEKAVCDCAHPHAREELNSIRAAQHAFHSCWNIYRAYPLRVEWKPAHLEAIRQIMRDELAHLEEVLPIVAADKRLGFHSECNRYMFTAKGIRRKMRQLRAELAE